MSFVEGVTHPLLHVSYFDLGGCGIEGLLMGSSLIFTASDPRLALEWLLLVCGRLVGDSYAAADFGLGLQ